MNILWYISSGLFYILCALALGVSYIPLLSLIIPLFVVKHITEKAVIEELRNQLEVMHSKRQVFKAQGELEGSVCRDLMRYQSLRVSPFTKVKRSAIEDVTYIHPYGKMSSLTYVLNNSIEVVERPRFLDYVYAP